MSPLYTPEQRQQIVDEYRAGATGPELAARHGVDPRTVHRWAELAGVLRGHGPRGRLDVRTTRIVRLRNEHGLSFAEVAAVVSMSKTGVRIRYAWATEGRRLYR